MTECPDEPSRSRLGAASFIEKRGGGKEVK